MLSSLIVAGAPLDNLFVRYEAQSSAYELEFARLGEVRATRPELRTYAAMLVNDHEAYSGALRDMATSKGIAVPSGLVDDDRARLDRLAQTPGAEFDNAFLLEARRVNSENMRSIRNEASQSTDPDIHAFIDHFIAMDTKHEAAAIALSENVVASKAPVINPPATGDTMAVVPPVSDSSMPVINPPPSDKK